MTLLTTDNPIRQDESPASLLRLRRENKHNRRLREIARIIGYTPSYSGDNVILLYPRDLLHAQ